MAETKEFLEAYLPCFLNGAGITIVLSLITVIFSSILGTIFALMKLSKIKILKVISNVFIEIVRGTPLLVQVYIFYYGIPTLLQNAGVELPQIDVMGNDFTGLCMIVITLALNSTAYVAEIIRSGIESVNKGQMEAARSLGLTHRMAMRYVIIPQAIKNILPALGNEFITVIKESSIVSVVGIKELMRNAQAASGATMMIFTPYLTAAAMYFILTFTLSKLLGIFERRMKLSD
ncbi:amino acid ABC transporter permease [Clostridium novyi]|uniref:Amino acid ABC transporter, permease protein n=1 Tax=Clostridium novyi (strain NT) TaxID=386415 RepID=A0PXC8_CLONN|nr:amino acid ABC transporter permease [Clostridium novyi]ABK61842.1 amino acid ABC transporter, permease protein [Clostridium novyi NT]KEH86340.1 arginine ABC transporter permease [Clostridium novyi A str. BKT29909]KEH86869.1 arginine ABC transporter permease [Clostridium novyi A str. NCTC 538]